MEFERDGTVCFTAPIDRTNTAYLAGEVVPVVESAQVSVSSTLPLNATLWDRRFAHFHQAGIQSILAGSLVTGMRLDAKPPPDPICEPGKLSTLLNAAPFPPSTSRAAFPLPLVHSDVHGPMVRTPSGMRNWVTYVDDYNRFYAVESMRTRDMAFPAIKRYKAWAETHTQHRIGTLRDDKGGEYMSNAFKEFCEEHGIARQHTMRNRPQQNGVAERVNRTLKEGIAAMLHEAQLPPTSWGEALHTLVYTLIRTPRSANPGIAPYEAFFGIKPDVSNLRIFGSLAYVHVRRINAVLLVLTWRSASSLAIRTDTRGGASIILAPSALWSLSVPSFTRGINLDSKTGTRRSCTILILRICPRTLLLRPLSALSPPLSPSCLLRFPMHQLLMLGGKGMHRRVLTRLQRMLILSKLVLQRTNSPQSLKLMRQTLLGILQLLFSSLLHAHRLHNYQRRIHHLHSLQLVVVAEGPLQPVRRSTRPHNPPGEWWKASYHRAENTPSVAPTPEPEQDEDLEQTDDEQEIKQESSDDEIEEEYAGKTHSGQSMPPPRTLKKALKRPDHARWQEAADLEIQAHVTNGTWEPCKLPAGRKAIPSKWVLTERFLPDGTIKRYKGQLVVKGCSQCPGFDYLPERTFSPTPRLGSIRSTLARAAIENRALRTVDISCLHHWRTRG